MTIAVSVVIRPSRALLFSVAIMASMALLAAILILFDHSHDFNLAWRIQISAIVTILAGAMVFRQCKRRKTFHIDISGIGQIRLTQYSGVSVFHNKIDLALDGSLGRLVHLSPDSIVWSQFLLLRLKPEQGAIISIPVLIDSVSGSGFAKLSVACRWIAAQSPSREMID
jgi:hypothetical protein